MTIPSSSGTFCLTVAKFRVSYIKERGPFVLDLGFFRSYGNKLALLPFWVMAATGSCGISENDIRALTVGWLEREDEGTFKCNWAG